MREYQNFLNQLKYVIINSGVVGKNIETEEERPDFLKYSVAEKKEEYANAVIDLSHWDENVDFKLAKENGILGVIHKSTQGTKYVDPKYAERRKEAEDLGLLWGAYHFGVRENGIDQADRFLETIGDTSSVLLALDIEESEKSITRRDAENFVNRVQKVTGRLPLIYGSRYFLEGFSTPILTKCPLWIARWRSSNPKLPKGWDKWTLWQYTDGNKGPEPHEVNGIGRCDRNKFNGTLEELKNFWLFGGICC